MKFPIWLGMLLVLAGCQEKLPVVENQVCVDDFFDGSYINNNIARGTAFFGEGALQFLTYFDVHGDVVVLKRNLDTGLVDRTRIAVGFPVADPASATLLNPHNFVSGGLDGEGYVHLILGAHNSGARHYVSKTPRELSGWQEIGGWIAREGHAMTYPYLVRAPDRSLWLFYRHGRSGYGDTFLVRGLTRDPSRIQPELLIDGRRNGVGNPTTLKYRDRWPELRIDVHHENSQYLFSPVFSADGCLHLAWTWRLSNFSEAENNPWRKPGFQGLPNRDIAYARTCDWGITWTNSVGTPYRLPLMRLAEDAAFRPEIIDRIDIGTSYFNHYGSAADAAGHPHYVYHHWDDQHRTQIWHLFHDGKGWVKAQVTQYDRDFPWNRHQASGLVGTALARPDILVDSMNDSALVITRSEIYRNRLELYRSKPPYRNWNLEILDSGSLGNWEPQIDKQIFRERRRVELLMNVVRDKEAYGVFDLRLTSDQQQVLDHFARGEPQDYPDYTILSPVKPYPIAMDGIQYPEHRACISALVSVVE